MNWNQRAEESVIKLYWWTNRDDLQIAELNGLWDQSGFVIQVTDKVKSFLTKVEENTRDHNIENKQNHDERLT